MASFSKFILDQLLDLIGVAMVLAILLSMIFSIAGGCEEKEEKNQQRKGMINE